MAWKAYTNQGLHWIVEPDAEGRSGRTVAEVIQWEDAQSIAHASQRIAELEDRYRWRPISEIHEDYGPCVLINLIEDPGHLEIHWCTEIDFDFSDWTHFTRITQLSTEDAERMREEAEQARG